MPFKIKKNSYSKVDIFTASQRSSGKVIFSVVSVCLSVCRWGAMWPLPVMHWASSYRNPQPFPRTQDPTKQRAPLGPALVPLDMFNLNLTVDGPTPPIDMFKLVYYESRTVGKRADCLLLEYFLVVTFVNTKNTDLKFSLIHISIDTYSDDFGTYVPQLLSVR